MKCSEIMTKNPKMCTPGDSVSVAIGLMWDYDCGSIPVVKDMDSKELVGIVTDRDIAMHIVKHAYTHPCEANVGDCMSKNVISCSPEDSIESAMKLMASNQIHRLPIIDQNNSCIGLLSTSDLVKCLEGMNDQIIAMLKDIYSRRTSNQSEIVKEEKKEDLNSESDEIKNDESSG